MGLPSIVVEFKKEASTARRRSERGILAVVVQDGTKVFDSKTYAKLSEVDPSDYTDENYQAIARAFQAPPYKVVVVRIAPEGTITDAEKILDTAIFNWVCAVPSTLQAGVAAYVKKINTSTRARAAKALVFGVAGADDMHTVNVINKTVKIKGEDVNTEMNLYLPRLGGILAAQPMTGSVTYYEMDDLEDIDPVADPDAEINKGGFVLIKDDDVIRIGSGVNTLQTVTGEYTVDQKKITVVEAMDLIKEDMIRLFKTQYLGKVKNTANNQALLVSSYYDYMQELAREQIIDENQGYDVFVDVNAMRNAWSVEGVDVSDLSDAQIKKKTFRASVFVAAKCHILDAMENITISISLS